jgi:hypothetical protein
MGELTYWPTDVTKTPNIITILIFKALLHNYLSIQPKLEIASDHTEIIATIDKHMKIFQQPQNCTRAKQAGKQS